ncbi:MAG: hypothetical protein OEY26_03745 [Nitrospinota bacterium]|nr:hypothetical protein [Nitrospinota bacterium]
MKKFWKIFGWIALGIFLQFKFNVLYGIVFLENLNFHDRAYRVSMKMSPTDASLRVLQVQAMVHHSLGSDYFANVYIPEHYKVLNKEPYLGAEAVPGYKAYNMGMRRKYRDVLSTEDFIIAPVEKNMEIPSTPVLVDFLNLNQSLHKDNTYTLATIKQNTQLAGPKVAEATYPQQLDM